jgi:uncharacterized protein (DUF608 family)
MAIERIKMNTLFPLYLPDREWLEFPAQGYSQPVAGTIFTSQEPPCCGIPLGGLGTGCIDLDARGVFGFSSLFNPWSNHPVLENWRMPRKTPRLEPFIGLSIEGETWLFCTPEMASGQPMDWCTEPQMLEAQHKQLKTIQAVTTQVEGVQFARRIETFGHYPIADLEFLLDAPIQVGLRAWSPFIPGDLAASNTPAALFEVHLRSLASYNLEGKLAFSFAGPDSQESGGKKFLRRQVKDDLQGMWICCENGVEYCLAAVDTPDGILTGSNLTAEPQAWSRLTTGLPQPDGHPDNSGLQSTDGSTSLAASFQLAPGEEKIIRFVLAWYAPRIEGVTKTWEGENAVADGKIRMAWVGSPAEGDTHFFTHMYAARYPNALAAARWLAHQPHEILHRVLAWQSVIYQQPELPVWLKDSLVNNLALFAEDAYWFQAHPPLHPELFPVGAFAMNESPRGCPHMSCIPCDWYGNLPVVYFFPELARSTLRMFKEYQRPDGEIPFALGKIADLPDMATPEYYWQVSLNGMCYIDMVDRLWQRTGDLAVLAEFYPSVKKCNTFMMGLSQGPAAPVSFPQIGGMEWFEFGEWAGMASHLGGLRLAQLRMAKRMAKAIGDRDYAKDCQEWLEAGSNAVENELWTGSYYLNFYDPETGKKSDDVMGYQLDGEWAARFHGLEGVFDSERVKTTLETIKRCNVALTPDVGAANFARSDGSPLPKDAPVAYYGAYAMFPAELAVLAMTYIQAGEVEFGIELARKHWQTMCLEHGHIWDLPNLVSGDDGRRLFGTDYYQLMMLWALPAALEGEDLAGFCTPGGLVQRILDGR